MILKDTELYKNKTHAYLVPVLKFYGKTFERMISKIFKLAFGVHDTLLDGSTIAEQRNIYILCSKKYREQDFEKFIDWIKTQSYYQSDYIVGDSLKSSRHMIILKFPEKFKNSYDYFLQGNYSKMYSRQDVELYFKDAKIKNILLKNSTIELKKEYLENIKKIFDVELEFIEIENYELDIPCLREEEIFNCKIKDKPYFLSKYISSLNSGVESYNV